MPLTVGLALALALPLIIKTKKPEIQLNSKKADLSALTYFQSPRTTETCHQSPSWSTNQHLTLRWIGGRSVMSIEDSKIVVFLPQTSGLTSSRQYWSVTDKVCVSIPPFTSSFFAFFSFSQSWVSALPVGISWSEYHPPELSSISVKVKKRLEDVSLGKVFNGTNSRSAWTEGLVRSCRDTKCLSVNKKHTDQSKRGGTTRTKRVRESMKVVYSETRVTDPEYWYMSVGVMRD
jgi:hypothetical protein